MQIYFPMKILWNAYAPTVHDGILLSDISDFFPQALGAGLFVAVSLNCQMPLMST